MAESDLTSVDRLEALQSMATYFLVVGLPRAEVLALVAEIRNLRGMVKHLAARVAAQSELLSRRAEK